MNIRNLTIKTLSTFFGVGYFPLIPGTFASLVGISLFYFVKDNTLTYILLTLALLILGFLVTGKAERIFNKKDCRCIVIDEVGGIFLSLTFLPYDIKLVLFVFIVFRILDTLKPYPAGFFQNLKGSLGIMGDDIIAGIYTNLIFQMVLRFVSFRTS